MAKVRYITPKQRAYGISQQRKNKGVIRKKLFYAILHNERRRLNATLDIFKKIRSLIPDDCEITDVRHSLGFAGQHLIWSERQLPDIDVVHDGRKVGYVTEFHPRFDIFARKESSLEHINMHINVTGNECVVCGEDHGGLQCPKTITTC